MEPTADPPVITRLRLCLQCAGDDARGLQRRTSQMFHTRLAADLEDLFERLMPALAGRTLALKKLVLDLGELPDDGYEAQFAASALRQLERRLRDLIASLPELAPQEQASVREGPQVPITAATAMALLAATPGTRADATRPQSFNANGEVGEAVQVVPGVVQAGMTDPVRALLVFLHDGYWPWPAQWHAGPTVWLRQQLARNTVDWTPVVQLCCEREDCLERLRASVDAVTQRLLRQAVRAEWVPAPGEALARWRKWSGLPGDAGTPAKPGAAPALEGISFHPASAARDATPADNSNQASDSNAARVTREVATRRIAEARQASELARAERAVARTGGDAKGAPLAVANAGLVLLWPMLPRLFSRLKLLEEQFFIDGDAQAKAVRLLDWLLWDDANLDGASTPTEDPDDIPQWRTPLTKLLCGWPPEQPLPGAHWPRPDKGERDILRQWLVSSVGLWPESHKVGAGWVRELYLRREGEAIVTPRTATLVVRRDACDVLLRDLPWPMREIRLPWMAQSLQVDWL